MSGPAWDDVEIDVESIALHEGGHGLSQAHFGTVFFDASKKYSVDHLHFSPRAVMNAVYWDTQRELLGSDVGGFCGILGQLAEQVEILKVAMIWHSAGFGVPAWIPHHTALDPPLEITHHERR